MPGLSGKTCVVTGAARGIGRAISKASYAEGAIVIVTDKDESAGTAFALRLGCAFERADVKEEDNWSGLAARVQAVDVAVDYAGVTGFDHHRWRIGGFARMSGVEMLG